MKMLNSSASFSSKMFASLRKSNDISLMKNGFKWKNAVENGKSFRKQKSFYCIFSSNQTNPSHSNVGNNNKLNFGYKRNTRKTKKNSKYSRWLSSFILKESVSLKVLSPTLSKRSGTPWSINKRSDKWITPRRLTNVYFLQCKITLVNVITFR